MSYKCEPAKVLVFRQQNALLTVGSFHEFPIDRPLLKLADGRHIVALCAQYSNRREIATLVSEKSHPRRLTLGQAVNCFVGDRIGGIREAGSNIVLRKARVCVQ